jgi:hypothetical protein
MTATLAYIVLLFVLCLMKYGGKFWYIASKTYL